MSETLKTPGSLLPPLPNPADFRNPVIARIAQFYWENADLTHLDDAVEPALAATPLEEAASVIKLAEDIAGVLAADDSEVPVWYTYPTNMNVDASGVITATIGTFQDVKYWLQGQLSDSFADAVGPCNYFDEFWGAANMQGGKDYADTFMEKLEEEIDRRCAIANAARVAGMVSMTPGHLVSRQIGL